MTGLALSVQDAFPQLPDELSQGASTLKIPQRAYFQSLVSIVSVCA